jgi:hypothetical protein
MTNAALIRPLAPRWLRGAARLDDEQALVYVDRDRADTYRPLSEPQIGLALTKVRTPADVLAFVQRFGLLHTGDPDAALTRASAYEPVLDFLREAEKLRSVVSVLLDVRRVVDRHRSSDDRASALARLKARGFTDTGLENLALASRTSADILTRGLTHKPHVYDRYSVGESVPPGQIRLGILPDTLLEICYLQVAFALADKEPLDVCRECGNPFLVEDRRQQFCSSKCGNRARFRRFQQKRPTQRKRSQHGKTKRTR